MLRAGLLGTCVRASIELVARLPSELNASGSSGALDGMNVARLQLKNTHDMKEMGLPAPMIREQKSPSSKAERSGSGRIDVSVYFVVCLSDIRVLPAHVALPFQICSETAASAWATPRTQRCSIHPFGVNHPRCIEYALQNPSVERDFDEGVRRTKFGSKKFTRERDEKPEEIGTAGRR